ncbi:hypothetical protein [Arthrobacter sp. FW306-04-A]|uniref:hypothetical protein n=1 Tax=Arthrobacter sp. FW306-04-A TaxID=2879619 RepID=UPI0037C11C2A|nr:hypothetical protein LFT43_17365 [Arthrobacter sp. FW306-04-A]
MFTGIPLLLLSVAGAALADGTAKLPTATGTQNSVSAAKAPLAPVISGSPAASETAGKPAVPAPATPATAAQPTTAPPGAAVPGSPAAGETAGKSAVPVPGVPATAAQRSSALSSSVSPSTAPTDPTTPGFSTCDPAKPNTMPNCALLTVNKVWVVNGQTIKNGDVLDGVTFNAALKLTFSHDNGPNSVPQVSDPAAWGEVYYVHHGRPVSIEEQINLPQLHGEQFLHG